MKDHIELVKPGRIMGNAVTFAGGFLLAAAGRVDLGIFIASLAGISLVIGSACAFNNVIDRSADVMMERTKRRVLVTGGMTVRSALAYAAVLGIAGFALMWTSAGIASTAAAAVGFFFYVFMYSLWFKPRSAWGTAIGSIAGATPPVAGYAAVTGRIDLAAVVLFAIMVAWQMPHFFAIAVRRRKDYAAARVPVLPVVRDLRATKVRTLWYVVVFTVVAPLLAFVAPTGPVYPGVAITLGLFWTALAAHGLRFAEDDGPKNAAWARDMFGFSLVVMMVVFVAIGLSGFGR